MPDRTTTIEKRRASDAIRARRYRNRRRAEREAIKAAAVAKAAKVAERRARLAAERILRGKKPAKLPTERSREFRARAAERVVAKTQWYGPAVSRGEAIGFIKAAHPVMRDREAEVKLVWFERECRRYELNVNECVLRQGIERARQSRAAFAWFFHDQTDFCRARRATWQDVVQDIQQNYPVGHEADMADTALRQGQVLWASGADLANPSWLYEPPAAQ